jgi:hypothetical protein
VNAQALPLIVRDEPPGDLDRLPQPDAKADSEIFNKFGRSIESDRRCTMHDHDSVSDGFLALIVTALVLLCSSWVVLAFKLA